MLGDYLSDESSLPSAQYGTHEQGKDLLEAGVVSFSPFSKMPFRVWRKGHLHLSILSLRRMRVKYLQVQCNHRLVLFQDEVAVEFSISYFQKPFYVCNIAKIGGRVKI